MEDAPELLACRGVTVHETLASIASPLKVSVSYTVTTPLRRAYWDIAWVVDSVRRRHIIRLGATPVVDSLPAGDHSFTFQSAPIDTSSVKATHLSSIGLLTLTLHGAREASAASGAGSAVAVDVAASSDEIGSVQLVVQASQRDAEWMRMILNPFDAATDAPA